MTEAVAGEEEWDTDVNEGTQDQFNKANFGNTVLPSAPTTTTTGTTEKDKAELQTDLVTEQLAQAKIQVAAEEPPKAPKMQHASKPVPLNSTGNGLKPLQHKDGHAFTEDLSPEALEFFNELTQKPFADQAVAFLNAYWSEVGDQAEFIFSAAWETMKYADMHTKGVSYIHLYEEGNDLDFNIGLYFYEKLCKLVLDSADGKKWREDPKFASSMPTMMTAIVRKKELREKVDVNFDGRISFLEYLLYQYKDKTNPADFTQRAMKHDVAEHPEITKARNALQKVNEAIRKYEEEKARLEALAAKPGVKGLGAKHQLAILHAGPLAEELNKALITAEAAVRIATRKFANGKVRASNGTETEYLKPTEGSLWWLNRDLQAKKVLYGRKAK